GGRCTFSVDLSRDFSPMPTCLSWTAGNLSVYLHRSCTPGPLARALCGPSRRVLAPAQGVPRVPLVERRAVDGARRCRGPVVRGCAVPGVRHGPPTRRDRRDGTDDDERGPEDEARVDGGLDVRARGQRRDADRGAGRG